jgi:PKHD-type hydroxylase
MFSPEQFDLIDTFVTANADKIQSAEILSDEEDIGAYRRTDLIFLEDPSLTSIYATVADAVTYVNANYYKWALTTVEKLQYSMYREDNNGFYCVHTDSGLKGNNGSCRKLSFSILLNDPTEFEGGELLFHYGPNYHSANLKKNQLIFFPSYLPHSVTPVTKGVRKSLVGWVQGPNFV